MGGDIVVPAGTFYINPTTATSKNYIHLKGAGRGATTLSFTSTGVGLDLVTCNWWTFSDMTIQLLGTPQSVVAPRPAPFRCM